MRVVSESLPISSPCAVIGCDEDASRIITAPSDPSWSVKVCTDHSFLYEVGTRDRYNIARLNPEVTDADSDS